MITKRTHREVNRIWFAVLLLLSLACPFFSLAQATSWNAADAQSMEDARWKAVNKMKGRIKAPKIRARDFFVESHYGAADKPVDVRPHLQGVIDSCSNVGGGRVVVASGRYFLDGPIHLRNDVELHLEQGAELVFSADAQKYLPMVKVRWEGTVCYNYSPLIYAYRVKNVAITGRGIINGNGREWSITWRKLQKDDQNLLREMGRVGTPESERLFGEGHFLRPTLIELYECKNVLLADLTIKNSPFWTVHPVFCENVILRRLSVFGDALNDDGIDPDSSEDVLIEYCTIDTHDDAISVKAGRDQDAWSRKGSNRIFIENNTLSSQSNAFCIGSEMSGGVAEVYMRNNTIKRANNAINLKCNLDRGGSIAYVFIRDVTVDSVSSDLVKVQMDYHSYRGGNFPTHIHHLFVKNVDVGHVGAYPVQIIGVEQSKVSNVYIDGLNVPPATASWRLQDTENVIRGYYGRTK